MSLVFGDGIHLYYYPKKGGPTGQMPGGGPPDAPRLAAHLRSLGVSTLIAHDVPDATRWMTAQREKAFVDAGISVAGGCGSNGPNEGRWQLFADGINRSLDRGWRVMFDWEEAWCERIGKDSARRVVDRVLAEHPDAPKKCADNPWWAPLYIINSAGKREATHPNAPTREFGDLATSERDVQAYGAPHDGASRRMLAWARNASQYDAIAKAASRDPWVIGPSVQAYRRSLNDHVKMLTAEPRVFLWQWTELDANCLLALRVTEALKAKHFVGPTAVRDFQGAEGLQIDGIVGPMTLAALGL